MILNADFKVLPLYDAKCLRNSTNRDIDMQEKLDCSDSANLCQAIQPQPEVIQDLHPDLQSNP